MGRAIFRLKKIEIQSFITEFQAKEMLTIMEEIKDKQRHVLTKILAIHQPGHALQAQIFQIFVPILKLYLPELLLDVAQNQTTPLHKWMEKHKPNR